MNSVTQVSYDEILVIINRFSKMTKFVLVKSKQTTEQLIYVLIKRVDNHRKSVRVYSF